MCWDFVLQIIYISKGGVGLGLTVGEGGRGPHPAGLAHDLLEVVGESLLPEGLPLHHELSEGLNCCDILH